MGERRYCIFRPWDRRYFSAWGYRKRQPYAIFVHTTAASGWSRNRIGGSGPWVTETRGELDATARELRRRGHMVIVAPY